MGLFDEVAGALAGNAQGGNNGLLEAAMQLLNNPQTGGLAGLVNHFQQGGLGEVVKSWISTGQNLPVSAEQLQSVLGGSTLQGLAAQLGMSHDQVAGGLAGLLPQLVDKLTPDGTLPEGGDLLGQGLGALGGKLFG